MSVRLWILIVITMTAVAALVLHGPIPQPAGYHQFADQRALWGVPNFGNVVSNLPFLAVGALGFREIVRGHAAGIVPELAPIYACVFVGIFLVGLGSGYYHLAPSDTTLIWDRLPMTITFTALFAMIVGEHIEPKLGRRLLVPLLVGGIASVWYWRAFDDLRPYAIVQFLPLLLVPVILLAYTSRLAPTGFLWGLIAGYVAAKLLEYADAAIYAFAGLLSGHTLKHLTAGLSMYLLLLAVRKRRLVSPSELSTTAFTLTKGS